MLYQLSYSLSRANRLHVAGSFPDRRCAGNNRATRTLNPGSTSSPSSIAVSSSIEGRSEVFARGLTYELPLRGRIE